MGFLRPAFYSEARREYTFIAAAPRFSPYGCSDYVNVVSLKRAIPSDQRHCFYLRLHDQKTVERITVMERQMFDGSDMLQC